MSKAVTFSLPPIYQNYQKSQQEQDVQAVEDLCLWIQKNGYGLECTLADTVLNFLKEGKNNCFSSLSGYLQETKPALLKMRDNIETHRGDYNQHRQETAYSLKQVLGKIDQAQSSASCQIQKRTPKVNWLNKVKTAIVADRKNAYIAEIQSSAPLPLKNYECHFEGLTQEEKQEVAAVGPDALYGKAINDLARPLANVHEVVETVFEAVKIGCDAFSYVADVNFAAERAANSEYSYKEVREMQERAKRGEDPEHNQMMKEITPDWIVSLGEGIAAVDQKLHAFDQTLQQNFYSQPEIVRNAAWGALDIAAPAVVSKTAKGIKYLVKETLNVVNATEVAFQTAAESLQPAPAYAFAIKRGTPSTLLFEKPPEVKFVAKSKTNFTEPVAEEPLFCYEHRASYNPALTKVLQRMHTLVSDEGGSVYVGIYKAREAILEILPVKDIRLHKEIAERFPDFSKKYTSKPFDSSENIVTHHYDKSLGFIEKVFFGNPNLIDFQSMKVCNILCEVLGIDFSQALRPKIGLKFPELVSFAKYDELSPYVIKTFTPDITISQTIKLIGLLPLESPERQLLFMQLSKALHNGTKGLSEISLKSLEGPSAVGYHELLAQFMPGSIKAELHYAESSLSELNIKIQKSAQKIAEQAKEAFTKNPGGLGYAYRFKTGENYTVTPNGEIGILNPGSILQSFDGAFRATSYAAEQYFQLIEMIKTEAISNNLTLKEIGQLVRVIENGIPQPLQQQFTKEALLFFKLRERFSITASTAMKIQEGQIQNGEILPYLVQDMQQALAQAEKELALLKK